jgi:hypothetical protein
MKYALSLLIIMIFCFHALPAMACRCMAPSDELAANSFKEADSVIEATVLSASAGWGSTAPIIKFQVKNVIKGHDIPDLITADYNPNSAACGNNYEIGETVIVALYDTRSLIINDANTRGYGFRVMISCHQEQVEHYVKHMIDKNKTPSNQPEKDK